MRLNLAVSTVPVELDLNGNIVAYELREMSGAQRDSYLDSLKDRVRMDATGKPTVTKFEGMQADLISRCLYLVKDNTVVDLKTVQGWPANVVTALYQEAQKLNGLNVSQAELAQASKNV